MLKKYHSLLKLFIKKKPTTTTNFILTKALSHADHRFIRKVVDSCKLEVQIASAIEWIHQLYRRGILPTEVYQELVHHAIYKEEQIITENVHKNLVLPYLKRRADEIVEEERRKKIRILKPDHKSGTQTAATVL
jgi:hypothetical protein